jgi:hypothetical protein
VGRDGGGVADDRDDDRLQARTGEGAAERGQRVDAAVRAQEAGVEVLLAGLLLLRPPVVVDREEDGAAGAGRGAEVDGGLAAVGADLQQRAQAGGPQGGLVEGEALGLGHEAERGPRRPPEVVVHRTRDGHQRRSVSASAAPGPAGSRVAAAVAPTRADFTPRLDTRPPPRQRDEQPCWQPPGGGAVLDGGRPGGGFSFVLRTAPGGRRTRSRLPALASLPRPPGPGRPAGARCARPRPAPAGPRSARAPAG